MFDLNLSIVKERILKAFGAVFAFVILETLNQLFLQPYLQQTNTVTGNPILFESMINNMSWIIIVTLLITIAGMLWKWHRKDEKKKREDLIVTLIKAHEAQETLSIQLMNHHVQDLKDNFLSALKVILRDNEVDIPALETLLNYKFDHYVRFKNINKEKVDKQIHRLKLHQSNDILHEINHENWKKKLNEGTAKEDWQIVDLNNRIGQ